MAIKAVSPFLLEKMIKQRKNIKEEVLFIDCLDSRSLEALNNLFGTHHSKKSVRKDIKVARAEQKPGFYKKLMEQRTGVEQ